MVGCLLVSHMSYIEFQPLQVSRGGLWRWRWCVYSCLLLALLWLLWCLVLCLPGHAILLNESPINRRPDKLTGGDWHSIELTEACNQSRKSQGPVGLLWVNSIRDQLSHMYTHLCQYRVDQLTLRQGEVRVMVTGENVAKQQRHPDLCENGHADSHDPHPSPCCGPGKVLPRHA